MNDLTLFQELAGIAITVSYCVVIGMVGIAIFYMVNDLLQYEEEREDGN